VVAGGAVVAGAAVVVGVEVDAVVVVEVVPQEAKTSDSVIMQSAPNQKTLFFIRLIKPPSKADANTQDTHTLNFVRSLYPPP